MKKTSAELVEVSAATQLALRDLRTALGSYATGVTIISTAAADGQPVGITVNSFASLSLEPPLILWSLNATSPSRSIFDAAPHFAVNVLAADQTALSRRFATSTAHKFKDVPTTQGRTGVPVLQGCAAVFECRRQTAYEAGDHRLYIGCVEHYFAAPERAPLLFHLGHYRELGPLIER
ncbi:MAG TPA: flavin reductase family protein [Burkholderiales bacterium]|nr:flavin reductase family protein [Burkholderiales bacterium]